MKRRLLLFLLMIGAWHARAQSNNEIKNIVRKLDSLNNKDAFEQSENLARLELHKNIHSSAYERSTLDYYIGYALKFTGSDSAVYYLEQALYYGKKAENPARIFDALESLCEIYCNKPGYEGKRDTVATQLRAILDTARSSSLLAKLYGALSTYYNVNGNHEMQVQYDIKSIEVLLQRVKGRRMSANDSANLMISYMKVGESYIERQQYEKAMEYLVAARPYTPAFQPSILAYYYRDLAICYASNGRLKPARNYADSLLRLKQLPNAIAGEIDDNYNAIYLTIADHFLQQEQADSALSYLKQILPVTDSTAVNPYVMNALNLTTGKALMLKENYEDALLYLKRSEAMFASMKKEDYAQVLKSMAECYAGLNQWEHATQYYQKYVPLRDTLYNQSAKQSIAIAEARFQNKEKQEQINTQRLQLSYAQKQRITLITGLVLAGLTILLLAIIYRNKKRNADILAAKNKALDEANATKAKLFGIIGHDLRSPINQVYQFLKLQQRDPTRISEAEKEALSHKIQSATGSLLETMEDLLLWSKTQLSAFNISLQEVAISPILTQCLDLLQLNTNAKQLIVQNNVPLAASVRTDPYFLQIILRNLLQNAVKAAPQGSTITITFHTGSISMINEGDTFSQQDYERAISDNNTKTLSGLGLKLVDELSQKVGAGVHFEVIQERNTKVVLSFV